MCLRDFFELQKRVVGCICAIFFGGPVLIVIGIIILAGAGTKTRENGIASYNTAVSTWTSTGYNTYNSWPGTTLVFNNVNMGFTSTPASNNPAVEVDAGINTYTNTLVYTATPATANNGAAAGSFPGVYQSSSTGSVNLKLNAASSTSMYSGSVTTTYSNSITNYCSSSSSSGSRCSGSTYNSCTSSCLSNYGGDYNCNSNVCQTNYVLSSICLVVNPATNMADTTWNGNPGCVPLDASNSKISSGMMSAIGATNGVGIGGYTAYRPSQGTPVINWASLQVTVRSSQDPYVTATRVTSGNPASFGLSVGAKIGLGIGLIVGGLLWTFVVFGVIYCLVKSARRRKATGGTVMGQSYSSGGGAGNGYAASVPVASVVGYYPGQQPQQQMSPQPYPQMGYPPAQAPGLPVPSPYPQPMPYAPQQSPPMGYPPQYAPQYPPQQQMPYAYPPQGSSPAPLMQAPVQGGATGGGYPYPPKTL